MKPPTHWMHADELRRRYPRVEVNPRALFVDEGDVLTSAGTAAGIDLCLHIVRRDFGAAVAAEVGRRMVVAPQREVRPGAVRVARPAGPGPGQRARPGAGVGDRAAARARPPSRSWAEQAG
ncbi:hypothetical protein [Nonomuraea dietziae]|uniref:hypothetical protein n=1 Tax=Nonomuraea dietziae TaxID=65515 RepID=UPI0031E366DB